MRPITGIFAVRTLRRTISVSRAGVVMVPLLAVLLLSACTTTSGTVGNNPHNAGNPNAPITSGQPPTPTVSSADATPTPLPPPPSSATDGSQVPGFSGAGAASAGSEFSDVSFPSGSVSTTGSTFTDVYTFQIINVCTNNSDANSVRNFFSSNLPGYGWGQSATYPYHGNVASNCGDPYCWRKANGVVRYVSLENVNSTGSLAVYSLRLATAPTPTFNMVDRYNSQNVPQGTTVTVTASCGNGEQMVGGGYWISDSNVIYEPGESYPSSASAWTSAIQNNSPQTMQLWTYVECVQANFPLNVQILSKSLSLAAGGMAPVYTECPASATVAVGGGFRTSDPSGLTGWAVTSTPGVDFDSNAWTVNVQAKFGALTETTYLLCASANAVSSRIAYSSIHAIGPSGYDNQVLTCNANEYATDGGFTYNLGSEGNVFYYMSAPASASTWIAYSYNRDSSSSHDISSATFCVTPNPVF